MSGSEPIHRRRLTAAAALGLGLLLVAPAGRAGAQYWGGGWGWGGGPFGNMGMTLADQEMAKTQMYANNYAQYDLMNAQSAQAYQAANLMRQEAISSAMRNTQQAVALRDQYNVRTKKKAYEQMMTPTAAGPALIDQLIGPDGRPAWPKEATVDGSLGAKREAAGNAIAAAARSYRSDGVAPVRQVNDAKARLYAYGNPALSNLRSRDRGGEAINLRDYMNSMLTLLDVMAEGATGEK